jgi:hypothetical protein
LRNAENVVEFKEVKNTKSNTWDYLVPLEILSKMMNDTDLKYLTI